MYTLKAVREDFLQQNYTTIKICINYACRELGKEIKFISSNGNQLHFIHILYLFTYTEFLPGQRFARFQAKGRRRCPWAATCCNVFSTSDGPSDRVRLGYSERVKKYYD